MNFIKRNYKKIILGLSLCLSLFVGIFAFNCVNADTLEYDNGYSININAHNVLYSNTINISNTKQYDLSMPITYTLNDNQFYTEFTSSNIDTDEYGYQVICNFDFINKYIINDYTLYNFIPYSNIIVSITFDIEMEMYDESNDAWNYEQLNLIADSPYNMNGLLYENDDFYNFFGIVNTYASELFVIDSEVGNYFYLDSNGYTINAIFVLNSDNYSTEFDFEDLNTLAFGFNYDKYVSNGLNVKFNIQNLDIGNDSLYYYLMNKYKSDYNSKSQQYNDYVDNHSYTNSQYNDLNDHYNDLQNDYNELQSNYNKLNNTYNALINSSAPFNNDNINSIQVSTTNNGVISGYNDLLSIYDRELQIESSILRDIVVNYTLQESSNVGVIIDLKLNNLAYIPYVEIKANSSGFEYEFILKNNDTNVYYSSVDSNDGPYDNGLLQDYGDFEFNRVIITIYNVNDLHYGDSNSYLLTSISFFDGYSQAMKDNQVTIDSYKNQINILNSEIADLSRSVSELQTAYNNLSVSYENMLSGNNFANLFFTIAQTPFESFKTIWNVDFLGVNLSGFVTGILFIGLIIWLIKKVF